MTPPSGSRPLHQILVDIAGSPDDTSALDVNLRRLTHLTAAHVTPVDYASITASSEGAEPSVAMGSELALAVDEAQFAEEGGGSVPAARTGTPVVSDDIAVTVQWPRFRQAATDLGLEASLSIPVFAGRGVIIATLTLYAHDKQALSPLSNAVAAVYHRIVRPPLPELPWLDEGSTQLVTGIAAALEIQETIQIAIGVVMAQQGLSADPAYAVLRERAALAGMPLIEIAAQTQAGFD